MSVKRLSLGCYDFAAYLSFIAYAAGSVAVPIVLCELSNELGFPVGEGGAGASGALQVGRGLAMVTSMTLCGFTAAWIGKRRNLMAALAFIAGGLAAMAFSRGYATVLVCAFIAGIGEGVVEGLLTPWIQDLHADDEPSRYVNFSHAFWSIGIFTAVIAIGCLLRNGVSWRIILLSCGALCAIPIVLYMLPTRVRFRDSSADCRQGEVLRKSITVLSCPRVWLFIAIMLFAGGGEFSLTFWGPTYIRLEIANNALLAGIGSGLFSVGMIIGRIGPALLVPQRYLKRLLVLFGLCGTMLGVALVFCHDFATLCLVMLVIGIFTGPFWPSTQSLCSELLPELDSTLIFIVMSCAGVPGCALFTWIIGLVGDAFGFRAALGMVPVCFALFTALTMCCEIGLRKRETQSR